MAERQILYKLKPALQSQDIADAVDVTFDATNAAGILGGVTDAQTALNRLDGTGIGATIFQFTGNYSAQSSNMTEWFGNRQQTRLRCTDNGGVLPVTFTLPGTTALTSAFDTLVTLGLPEVLRFVIEYTGPSTTFLRVVPRAQPSPQIAGTSSIIIRTGIAATVEITRTSGTISDYVFQAIGGIGDTSAGTLDSIKLINTADQIWNANDGGQLPSTGVVKGNAYKVANAPADGSGRFGEVMQNDDRVVWEADTFTSWTAEPHQWFVIPAHEVRRITALEHDFLTGVQQSPESNRNRVIRGSNYADSVAEIRLKLYTNRGDYSAADLNTTGDIDEYTNASNQTAYLAIRLPGVLSALTSVLPTLYVYSERSNQFTRILNLQDDFTHQGDFSTESDYLSDNVINYAANDTLRIYVGTVEERFSAPDLDIEESNLSDEVQAKLNSTRGSGTVDEQRLTSLESKMDGLFPLTPDVSKLNEWADAIGPDVSVQEVRILDGYSKIADFRDASTRYESAGVTYAAGTNVVTYTGLGSNLYRTFGFKVTAPADQTLMWIVDGTDRIPFIDMTGAGKFRINSYREVITAGDVVRNQLHFLTRTSGATTLGANDGNVQTFTVPNYPTNSTATSRTMQASIEIYVDGTDTLAAGGITIEIPNTNVAQSRRTVQHSEFLGPLYGNRTVDTTVAYTVRVSGDNIVVDFELISAPSDVTVSMTSVAVYLNYTAPSTTTRVDNFQTFQDEGGDYTFTGENEVLITFQPHQANNSMAAVGAAIRATGSATEFNDIEVPIPEHTFESVEIPDTIDFRTFSPVHFLRHSDLSHLLTRRNVQWCYGLAELVTVRDLSITSQVDFFQPTENTNRLVSVMTGTAAPTSAPQFIGQIFVDTSGKTVYIATDTGGSGDWSQVSN